MNQCLICGKDTATSCGYRRSRRTKYCLPCSTVRERLYQPIRQIVQVAIRRGELKRASEYQCVDCGKQADCWDHRDYNHPLAVDPVCDRCDSKRGPGKPPVALAEQYPFLLEAWRAKHAA